MDKNEELKVIKEMQETVKQMYLDDVEENPDSEVEMFDCDCCGKTKPYAGSIEYPGPYRLCNDCVLYAEIGFQLKKINSIQELIDKMEDKRLEEVCEYVKQEEARPNN